MVIEKSVENPSHLWAINHSASVERVTGARTAKPKRRLRGIFVKWGNGNSALQSPVVNESKQPNCSISGCCILMVDNTYSWKVRGRKG